MCVRQSMLEDLHRGLSPITKTGDYSDVVVVDAEGRRLPWPEISRFDEDEMRDLMRQIVNKVYTFLAKMDDPDFAAWRDFLQPQTEHWDKRVQVSYGKIALRNFRHLRQEARAMRGICCETLRPEAIFPGKPAIWSG